jgi:hypothetical protein
LGVEVTDVVRSAGRVTVVVQTSLEIAVTCGLGQHPRHTE